MKKLICSLLILSFISCSTNSKEIQSITTKELNTLISKKKIQLLDVRTEEEIKQGAIKNAVFADFFNDNFYTQATKQLDKNKPVYVYCKSGNRSTKACKILQKNGFLVYTILGGYTKWKTENYTK